MRGYEVEAVAQLLMDTQRALKERTAKYLHEHGLSLSTVATIRQLRETPGVALSELSRLIGLSKGYVSVIVDQLEGEGWVRKLSDPSDQRLTRLELTDAGQRYHDELKQRYQDYLIELMGLIPPEELRAIHTGLRSLQDSLQR